MPWALTTYCAQAVDVPLDVLPYVFSIVVCAATGPGVGWYINMLWLCTSRDKEFLLRLFYFNSNCSWYCIAGNFCWCKVSQKCLQTLQTKFSWLLFLLNMSCSSYTSTKWLPCLFLNTWKPGTIKFDVDNDEPKSQQWQGLPLLYRQRVSYLQGHFLTRLIFSWFLFLRAPINPWKSHKFAPSENFPLYGILAKPLCYILLHKTACLCKQHVRRQL